MQFPTGFLTLFSFKTMKNKTYDLITVDQCVSEAIKDKNLRHILKVTHIRTYSIIFSVLRRIDRA